MFGGLGQLIQRRDHGPCEVTAQKATDGVAATIGPSMGETDPELSVGELMRVAALQAVAAGRDRVSTGCSKPQCGR